jgi:hypothetical protein
LEPRVALAAGLAGDGDAAASLARGGGDAAASKARTRWAKSLMFPCGSHVFCVRGGCYKGEYTVTARGVTARRRARVRAAVRGREGLKRPRVVMGGYERLRTAGQVAERGLNKDLARRVALPLDVVARLAVHDLEPARASSPPPLSY